ncbi:hypothetical protein LSH36_456g03061 [Paralvinella palmiformis]|uniref:Uncharacterized protein n=1 Tax=Paralvinella palmiformis TaxID=53620 RepID=A0AAD9JAX3_9ANNE|nr:hypothetical protein LSH36_456g03061 [Paralvinella palmiformis]
MFGSQTVSDYAFGERFGRTASTPTFGSNICHLEFGSTSSSADVSDKPSKRDIVLDHLDIVQPHKDSNIELTIQLKILPSTFGGFTKSASTPTFGTTVKTATDSAAPAFGAPSGGFGSAAPTPSFRSTTNPPAFGVTTSTPTFGHNIWCHNINTYICTPSQQTKPPTVFVSGTATPSFQFGGQQPTVPQPSTGAMFQFGQNAQQPAAPTSGFNFGAGIASPSAGSTVTPISFGGSTPVNTNFTGTANPAGSTFQFNAAPSGANSNPFSVTTPASARRVKTARRKLPRK